MTNEKHPQTALIQINELDMIFNIVEGSQDFSPNLKAWVKNARLKLEHGLSMERAFGISAKNGKARRNDLLTHYASSLVAPTDWDRAQMILDQLNRLNAGLKCSEMVRQANYHYRIPRSRRQIFRIIH